MRKGQHWQGDYILEDSKSFFDLLPYLYPRIEGRWEICVIDPTIKELRQIFDTQLKDCIDLKVYADQSDINQFLLERPDINTEKVSNYTIYQDLFKTIDCAFDPKAVSEIYQRAGPDIDNLKVALEDVIKVSNGSYVTMTDVNKVLLPNKRTYANEVIRAFIGSKNIPYRWSLLNRIREELGDEYAFYSMFKYVRKLLVNKNKYLINEEVPKQFEKDVKEIDALTVDYTYALFMQYNSPTFLPAIFFKLERRRHS